MFSVYGNHRVTRQQDPAKRSLVLIHPHHRHSHCIARIFSGVANLYVRIHSHTEMQLCEDRVWCCGDCLLLLLLMMMMISGSSLLLLLLLMMIMVIIRCGSCNLCDKITTQRNCFFSVCFSCVVVSYFFSRDDNTRMRLETIINAISLVFNCLQVLLAIFTTITFMSISSV